VTVPRLWRTGRPPFGGSEPDSIAVYAGAGKSGIFRGDSFASVERESIKKAVKNRDIRLVIATDAVRDSA
jgi:hypothetical protein